MSTDTDTDTVHYWEIEDMFESLLSDIYPDIEIGVLTFTAGQVLRACDPVAFRVEVSDYAAEYFEEAGPSEYGSTLYTRREDF